MLGDANPVYTLPVNQRDLERVLAERAAELGAEVRHGWEVTSFRQDTEQVTVVARGADGADTVLSAGYLVGCDGGSSLIRRNSGIGFPGNTDTVVDRSALIAPSDYVRFLPGGLVQIEGLGEIPVGMHRTEQGMFVLLPHDPQRPHVFTTEWEKEPAGNYPGRGPEMTLAEMEDSIERVLGVRVPLSPPPEGAPTQLRRLCYRNSRQADRYRDGRVFLAGDAAHVSHGPTLNTALNDAANLGWKLAAAVQGWAPSKLLDTYESERHPVGARVLAHTQAETALTAPGAEVTALRHLFTELLGHIETVRTIAGGMAGTDVRYDAGEDNPAPLAGWPAPPLEVRCDDGAKRRLAHLLHDARPLLVDLAGRADLAAAAEPYGDRVRVTSASTPNPPAPALLIRPDGYVAWAGADRDSLTAAPAHWFSPR